MEGRGTGDMSALRSIFSRAARQASFEVTEGFSGLLCFGPWWLKSRLILDM